MEIWHLLLAVWLVGSPMTVLVAVFVYPRLVRHAHRPVRRVQPVLLTPTRRPVCAGARLRPSGAGSRRVPADAAHGRRYGRSPG